MQKSAVILGILRLRRAGVSFRDCERRFGTSAGTINDIRRRFENLGLSFEELEKLQPAELENMFYPEQVRRKACPQPDFEQMRARITAPGSKVNVTMLWEEYIAEHPDGYRYTQFNLRYRQYVREHYGEDDVRMLMSRVPGERMYVDWVGDQPEIVVNPETGEAEKIHIFCATLGRSSLAYVEAFPNEKSASFVQGIVHALEYYGGAPKYIVPDNMKTAVTKHTNDEVTVTTVAEDLEDFYGVVVVPAPPHKPRGKSSVENLVRTTEVRVIEALREHVREYGPFPVVQDTQPIIDAVVEKLNNTKMRGRCASRREIFEAEDRPALKQLPQEAFTVWEYVYCPRVPNTYHVTYDRHKYSVPHTMAGKPVMLKVSVASIRIVDSNNCLVAEHPRQYERYPETITDPGHMPPSHAFYKEAAERDGAYYRTWARNIGPATAQVMENVLCSSRHEERMYLSCNRIVWHTKGISSSVVEAAARTCLEDNVCTYSHFTKTITELANGVQPPRAIQSGQLGSESIRGKEYFK